MVTNAYRLCCVIPCYNNVATISGVARRVREDVEDVFIIDDASNPETHAVIECLGSEGFHVITRARNGGKGAAVKTGFAAAFAAGFTHAIQVDADGQHDLGKINAFVERSRQLPESLILGHPVFDETAPLGRRIGRKITLFWTHIETLGRKVVDPMCGFRVYPLGAALHANAHGERMDFDIEIVVKMVRDGVPVVNLPVNVRYLTAEEGGMSSFRMFWDNVAISLAHTRLVLALVPWLLTPKRRRAIADTGSLSGK